jgi:RHS repeat-associated protein
MDGRLRSGRVEDVPGWRVAGLIDPVRIGDRLVGVLDGGAFHVVAADVRGTLLADRDGTPRLPTPYGVRASRPDLSAALDYVEKGYDADLATVRMGVRDYDPLLGQFWSPDPLFLESIDKSAESPVDGNLFSYAGNDPIGSIDPDGRQGRAINLVLGQRGPCAGCPSWEQLKTPRRPRRGARPRATSGRTSPWRSANGSSRTPPGGRSCAPSTTRGRSRAAP